ncbi:MAG TPA: hypothetical protein VFH69_09805 [Gemmatimonadota bacterium]|nr:hypothetical protein [Gemmatimonadota bacterium]
MDDTTLTILIIVGGILILAGLGWVLWSRSRSRRLKESFGPEYDRQVSKAGRSEGEKRLDERRKRVAEYQLRTLAPDDRVGFIRRWDVIQASFVDDPKAAIADAQHLVDEVMEARGYPIGDAQRQQEDVSVESPGVVADYRRARDIARRSDAGEASTEDLRQAIQHYRSLFHTLLEGGGAPVVEVEGTEVHAR